MKDNWIYTRHPISNPVGYCKYHKCDMNVKRLREKGCLSKENIGNRCRHFVANEEHGYWQQKNAIKAKVQARKIESHIPTI